MDKHGIERSEWERRFAARITEKACGTDGEVLTADHLKQIAASELESWTEDRDDWTYTMPDEAADEQMMNWDADE